MRFTAVSIGAAGSFRYLVSLWCAVGVCAFVSSDDAFGRPVASAALHIEKLSGSIERFGSWRSGSPYGVRLQATVCLGSASEARATYPSEIRITHFAVSKSRTRWWAARTVIDHAPWLVPVG